MNHNEHQNIVGFIWNIANKLRGPYRPPQYRKVMLPLVVLRRLDLVLEPTKAKVMAEKAKLEAKGIKDAALDKALSRVAVGTDRSQPLYNTSPFTFKKLLDDAPNIASNLVSYIQGFSPRASLRQSGR
jgi:type I restriction enzyme M protein